MGLFNGLFGGINPNDPNWKPKNKVTVKGKDKHTKPTKSEVDETPSGGDGEHGSYVDENGTEYDY